MEGAEKVLKNIIFDLGGVLLNIDMDKTSEAFVLLGWKDSEGRDISQAGYPVFEKLEVGKDTPEQFRENVRKILPGKATDEDIDRAWNAMLIDFPPSIIDYINHLKSKYRLFLLSNTNAIHLLRFRDVFYNSFGYSIDDLFVKTYYSHELGFRKPHPGHIRPCYRMLLSFLKRHSSWMI